MNGDEIYATFALLDEKQTGGDLVPLIHGIYLGSFIAIFTIVVLNLLIALFTNAYDAVKVSNTIVYIETEKNIFKMATIVAILNGVIILFI